MSRPFPHGEIPVSVRVRDFVVPEWWTRGAGKVDTRPLDRVNPGAWPAVLRRTVTGAR